MILATTVGFQEPPPPPPMQVWRDPATTKKGTAVIKGHVRSADGRPLRRAQIRAWTGDQRDALTTTTGLEGEYELTELPAGRYTLEATRSGYLRIQYGAASFGERGTPLEVSEGGKVEKIDFLMSRAGVVSGRVTDETGEAVAGVDIRAMQMQFYQGRKRIVPVSTFPVHVLTDDSGLYRLTGLPPGEYFIWGRLPETWMSDDKDPQMLSYAPTYFPGTADVSDARPVKITAGQEAGAIDFMLLPIRAATLSGTALASNGAPLARGRLMLSVEIMGPGGGTMGFAGNAVINDDGTWRINDVAPGEYTIRATGSVGDRPTETGVLPVTVHGVDLEGLIVTADAGGLISGRIVADTNEPLPASGSRPTVRTTPVSMLTGTVQLVRGQDDGVVGPDGSFTLRSPSGPIALRVFSLPRGWSIKAIDIGGRDFAGLPVDVPPGGTLAGVTIVISNRLPSLAGRITGVDGTASERATVLLFPVDPSRWIEAAANQRTVRPDRSGTYSFDAVRPGEYFVVALQSMESWQMHDPDFLALQKDRATKVTIGAEPVTMDLEVKR